MNIKRLARSSAAPQPPRRLHPFILFAAFLSTFYIGLIGPILPALVDRYGGNALTIGLLFSSYSFAQFLSAPIAIAYLLFWTIVILPSSNLPSLVADRLNWTPEQISPLLGSFGVTVVLMQLIVLPLLLRRFQEIHLAIVGGSIAGFGFFLIGLFPITGTVQLLYAGMAIYSLGQPLVQTCLTGAMSKSMGADVQGRVQGRIAAVMALAQVIGPLWAGWLYEAVSRSACPDRRYGWCDRRSDSRRHSALCWTFRSRCRYPASSGEGANEAMKAQSIQSLTWKVKTEATPTVKVELVFK
jgi:MFS family permease